MYQSFKKHCISTNLFNSGDRVLIAVSGGTDSTALLYLMNRLAQEIDLKLSVVHINHKLRDASDQEAIFVRDMATSYSINYIEKTWEHEKISLKVEEKARQFRYSVFHHLMVDFDKLVTAHHADDQAETFFMRLIRGNRLFNLSAIESRRSFANGELIRPLLPFSKAELVKLNIPSIEDESNCSDQFFRNRIRNKHLPLLSQENPKIANALVDRTVEVSYAKELISAQMQAIDQEIAIEDKVDLLKFNALTTAERYFFLQYFLEKQSIYDLSDGIVQTILSVLQNEKQWKIDLNANYCLVKDYHSFFIDKIIKDELLTVILQENGQFENDLLLINFGEKNGGFRVPLVSNAPVIIRARAAGDRIQLTEKLSKKVRRLFIDEKIPINERESSKIIEQNGKIIAVLIKSKSYLSKMVETDTIKTNLYCKWKG